jgi:cob(I)alamin adenosyltransferase
MLVMAKKRKTARRFERQTHQVVSAVGAVGRFACWWNKTSFAGRVAVITTAIIGVTGSIVGMSHVAQYELRIVQSQQTVATDRQTLFQLQQFLANAEKDPTSSKSQTAQAYIANLRQQIQETKDRLDRAQSSRK